MDIKDHKQQLLNKLYAPYTNCTACPLGMLGRTNVVFGDGNPDAQLMFIGEAPGKDEDRLGKPFVGRSGKLLTKILELAQIQRPDVFISNVVKCRPPSNRKPMEKEASICTNLLLFNQIKIIRPHVICTLGASALQGLLNNYEIKISQVRGKPIVSEIIPNTIILPTFHPAYILRNPKEMQTMLDDIQKAKTFLQ
ncbi:type-4 uracil-DNA glycosylase [soil metagenome]